MKLLLILMLYFSTIALSALIVGICWKLLANGFGLPSLSYSHALVLVLGVRALIYPIRMTIGEEKK